jgi:2-iminoacetate synthase
LSYYEVYKQYKEFPFADFFQKATPADVLRSLQKEHKGPMDFLTLLSPAAQQPELLEAMAQQAHRLTEQNFGKTITLFTPLYLANICENACVYCGFNRHNHIKRSKLTMEEVEREGKAIRDEGIRHIIILTGESRAATSPEYIADCTRILKKYVDSIVIEVYSLEEDEYKMLFDAGVDGFTMFQETYNEDLYPTLHPSGPKHDYRKRLDSPELACMAGYNTVNLGALLGLDDWRKETFLTGMHAAYLMEKYPGTDCAVSLPRIRPCVGEGNYHPACDVDDTAIVQAMTAYRCFLPRLGITVSTRETPEFRDHLIGLGVTKMSAGSITEVGGHGEKPKTDGQFEISDPRGVEEMSEAIRRSGCQPVYKDWEPLRRDA